MKKRLMRGLALTLICLLAMTAPSEAALSDTILLNETDDGVEVSVKLAETTEDKIFSLSISFQIDYTEGDGKGNAADFVFDEALPSVVQEYRYNPDDGILTLYISGRRNLFDEGELSLGTLEIAESETGTLTAQIGVAENRMEMVNAAHDAISGAVSVAGSNVISLGTPPHEQETPPQESEVPPQESETPPQESETLPQEPERPPATEGEGNETQPPQGGSSDGNGGSGGGDTNEGGGRPSPGRPVTSVKLPQTNTTVRPRPSESAGESLGAETTTAAETEETTVTKESDEETVSKEETSAKDEDGFTAVDGEISAQSGTNFLLFAGIVLAVLLAAVGGCVVLDRRKRAARHRNRQARHRVQTGNRSGGEAAQGRRKAPGGADQNTAAGSRGHSSGKPHKKE